MKGLCAHLTVRWNETVGWGCEDCEMVFIPKPVADHANATLREQLAEQHKCPECGYTESAGCYQHCSKQTYPESADFVINQLKAQLAEREGDGERLEAIREKWEWIKRDLPYKAPEQLTRQFFIDRLSLIGEAIDSARQAEGGEGEKD